MARVVLVGLPGVGKTTVGCEVARLLGVAFVDLDDVVEKVCGAPAADVLRDRGEASFRALELAALDDALAALGDGVLATGGGTVEAPRARALLCAEPLVVHLTASTDVLVARLRGGDRPLVDGSRDARLAELEARRAELYVEVADATVDASGPLPQVVEAICALVAAA